VTSVSVTFVTERVIDLALNLARFRSSGNRHEKLKFKPGVARWVGFDFPLKLRFPAKHIDNQPG
jgi:hypothetical protein